MNTKAETKEILQQYYDCLSKKEGWQSLLSEDILLTGTVAKESKGKQAFCKQ